jgi:hypothetical protein
MPARDALHNQMIFMDQLAPGGVAGVMLDGWERSQRGLGMRNGGRPPVEALDNPIGMFAPDVPYDEGGDGMRRYFEQHMKLALAYYVDPKMTALVTAAAESMPTDSPLRPHDLPSTHGFLHLPTGLAEVDIRGQLLIHNAVIWFQRAGGVDLWFMSNKHESRDMVNLRQRQMFGKGYDDLPQFMPAVYTHIPFGQGVPHGFGGTKVLPPEIASTLSVHRDPATGSYAWAWPEGYDLNEWLSDSLEIAPSGQCLWVVAMWRLMQQTLLDIRTETVDRPLRKAARKRNMKRDDVTVIALRKRKRTEGEGPETEIEWSHRWLVRGHWRQQWMGPKNGSPEERYQTPIWIHPHVKGPDDAPFLVREHVYSLER